MLEDLQDPLRNVDAEQLGLFLLQSARAARSAYGPAIPLSEVWDVHVSKVIALHGRIPVVFTGKHVDIFTRSDA